MEEIKAPKKERKFLKAVGNIAKVLANELVMGIARKFIGKAIDKVGNKRQGLSMALIIIASTFAIAQYPNTGNKQRLGFQTTADGLVWRGSISDTASIQPINNQNAWVIIDTINLKLYSFDFTSNVWNLISGGGGSSFTQPVDSLFFNVGVPTNNVDTAKMRWDSDLATVVLGLNDNVPNEIGFKNFWLVKNQTGSTITKGSIVYANGTVGASGRITVAKFIANGSIDAKYLLGITAHDLSNGENGYVISFGKIRQVNTDTFAAGAILYPSPTVAGVWTDVEPVAPNIDMPIGFCINSAINTGTIAIRVASGYKLSELHDVSITSPVESSSLYYKGGLWRDTTAALLVSDTSSMLTNYLRSGVAASTYQVKLNGTGFVKASGTTISYDNSSYLRTGLADSSYLKLTGGTLTGGLTGTNAVFSGSMAIGFPFAYKPLEVFSNVNDFVSVGTNEIQQFQWAGIHFGYRQPNYDYRSSAIVFQRNEIPPYIDATGKIHLLNVSYANGGRSADLRDAKLTISNIGGYVGINDTSPEYQLDVNGTFNASGNSLIGGTLGVSGATNISNTLSATTGTFTGLNVNNTTTQGIFTLQGADNNTATRIDFKTGNEIRRQIIVPTAESNMQFRTSTIGGTEGGYSFYTRRNLNAENLAFNIDLDGNSNFYGTLGVTGATSLRNKTFVGNVTDNTPISGENHNIRLESNDVSSIGFHDYLNTIGNIKFSGATGFVIGASDGLYGPHSTTIAGNATFSAPLTVNSSAVFNEAATDSDFRVESQANAHMLFVDASTSRVGIGYASPTKTLDVNGELRINTVTATPTSLLGKDGSNVVGNVTLGNSLTLSSGTLSVNNKITNINTSSYSILSTDYYIDNFNSSSTTIVLPSAASNLYRELKFKNSSTGALTANVDIIPLSGSGTTTTILSGTNAKWCTIVSDGADWRIMQSN